MAVNVYLPPKTTFESGDETGITVVHYESSAHLAMLFASNGGAPVVILTGAMSEDDQEMVAAAIRAHAIVAVEVRLEKWDGFSASPLSAACRGVIAGFGANGLGAAVAVLRAI